MQNPDSLSRADAQRLANLAIVAYAVALQSHSLPLTMLPYAPPVPLDGSAAPVRAGPAGMVPPGSGVMPVTTPDTGPNTSASFSAGMDDGSVDMSMSSVPEGTASLLALEDEDAALTLWRFLLTNVHYDADFAVSTLLSGGLTSHVLAVGHARSGVRVALEALADAGRLTITAPVIDFMLRGGHGFDVVEACGGVFYRHLPPEMKVRTVGG